MVDKVRINWEYTGKRDFANGTCAYYEEKFLGYLGGLFIPVILIAMNISNRMQWNYFQLIIAVFLAFDLGGGMISNSLNSGKRFYHSPSKESEGKLGKFLKNKLLFATIHIHPFIVGIIFNNFDWKYGLQWYLIFIISVLIVYISPLYLKRPLSMFMVLIALLINSFFILPIVGFEWFIPVLFLKIIYGHMVREEPYRKV
ncbi:hypothetical protein [Serpentinicella alkaliphila]|uniref:Uncharacterized protein n=1 Tax=Serpentinicella alkaliphila TaxID=1734049 RepID=A0A4R2TIX0_9FIRM|nr:hypothetical protein [Serpentinicella alkaliphila]QUH26495.1 hypothetical protein HZR23_12700 [Serpentinicella alkaliphila]TCQ03221.1 hypothetical protein EDD79_10109 [Serpentinicella alkaliphila]